MWGWVAVACLCPAVLKPFRFYSCFGLQEPSQESQGCSFPACAIEQPPASRGTASAHSTPKAKVGTARNQGNSSVGHQEGPAACVTPAALRWKQHPQHSISSWLLALPLLGMCLIAQLHRTSDVNNSNAPPCTPAHVWTRWGALSAAPQEVEDQKKAICRC